jgi:hypothetical protein
MKLDFNQRLRGHPALIKELFDPSSNFAQFQAGGPTIIGHEKFFGQKPESDQLVGLTNFFYLHIRRS